MRSSLHRFRGLVSALALAAALGLQAAPAPAQQAAPEEGQAPRAATALPAITVSQVTPRRIADRVMASGLIGAVERVLVQPQIEGEAIRAIEAEVGDTVSAGQILALLSDRSLILQQSQLSASRASAVAAIAQAEASVVESQAAADEAVRASDRAAQLAKQGSTSAAAAEQAAAAAAGALARVNVAQQSRSAAQAQLALVDAQLADVALRLERTRVIAPVAGTVVARNAVIGAIASGAAAPMFEIVRDGALELRADVSEQDILRLREGQPAMLAAIGQSEPMTGRIRLVEPAVDEASRLGRARITLDRPDLVRPGMFAEATITVSETEALTIPASAVGEGPSALVVRDGRVSLVPIETGIRDGAFVEVRSGLAAGDTVVTKAGAFVRDGDRITPVQASFQVEE